MTATLQWFALQTKTNCDDKVVNLLKKRGINCYNPINHIPVNGTNKFTSTQLFPGMVFIQLQADFPLSTLSGMQGVRGLVYWQQGPAVFADTEISALHSFMESHETVQVVKTGIGINNAISTERSAAFADNDKMYCLQLPSLGYQLQAKAETVTTFRVIRKTSTQFNLKNRLGFILGTQN